MAVIYDRTGDAFGDAFTRMYALTSAAREKEAERKRQEEAWKQYSQTFVPQQPTDATQVQVPVTEIPGQSGIATQPSAQVVAPQTQMQTIDMPSKDPYKQLEYDTGKEFAARLQALGQLQPQERQLAMRQMWQDREMKLADARLGMFNDEVGKLLAGYDPANPASSIQTKAKAMSLARKYKLDPNDALKMFDTPKTQAPMVIPRGGVVYDPVTRQPLFENPFTSTRGGGGGRTSLVDDDDDPTTPPVRKGKVVLSPLEKWAEKYEFAGRLIDENLIEQYEEKLASEDEDWLKKNQKKVNDAMKRMNQYWQVSSGGAYTSNQGVVTNPPVTQPTAPTGKPSLDDIFK